MRRQLIIVVFLAGTGLCAAQEGPSLPKGEMLLPPKKLTIEPDNRSPVSLNDWNGALKKLKAEREALAGEHLQSAQPIQAADVDSAEENAKLRRRLTELLTRLSAKKKTPPKTDIPPPVKPPVQPEQVTPKTTETIPPKKNDSIPVEGTIRPVDPLVLAHALFRAKNYEGSLRAYRLIDLQGMKAEERAPIQYLTAACLKRIGKTDEAAGLFREVANSKGDESLALCAQWQLSTMRWQKELGETLKEVRRRAQALGTTP